MSEKTREELIGEVADLIANAKRVVVFTGAGISTESGIPDFRGPDGLWTKLDPSDFTYQKFVGDKETRKKIWQLNKYMGLTWKEIEPNPAHIAVAELDKMGKLDCVITQNVDGLHQKAGVPDEKVIQLHGNMQWVKCIECGVRHSYDEVERWLDAGAEDLECVQCGGVLKPDAVFFGEAMPVHETMEAERRSSGCDLCIVVGSSLVVYPAAMMPQYAIQSGAKIVIINDGETGMDSSADVRIWDRAGEVMTEIIKKVKQKLGT